MLSNSYKGYVKENTSTCDTMQQIPLMYNVKLNLIKTIILKNPFGPVKVIARYK